MFIGFDIINRMREREETIKEILNYEDGEHG